MMTGVRTDTVHVVYTFSEAVRLVDAANKSNGVISEAFKLMFYNTTNPNSAHHEYDVDSDVTGQAYVNTTGRTISFALSDLKVATRSRARTHFLSCFLSCLPSHRVSRIRMPLVMK